MKKENYLASLIMHGLIILFMSYVLKGFYVDSFLTAILVALVISILNSVVKPVISFISWPITFLTLGLFKLVINGFILALADMILGARFEISSSWMAILSALIMSLLTSALGVDKDD